MPRAEQIKYEYIGDVSSLRKATSEASSLLNSFEKAAKKTFQALSGLKVADVFANSIKESLNYIENLNLFNVAMGESIDVGNEFVNTMSEIYGMDPSNIMESAGNFYQLTSAVNATKEASEVMSLQLTKAANDISSLFNVDIQTVTDNLSSGLRGMSRAVTSYGMDIRATTLQVTAASLGIGQQVETMSEADREGLRYITMMRQASNVMGDFAKTIESPANQLRVFKEQVTQLARAFGNFFIPILQSTLPYINGFVMALRIMLNYITALSGISDLDFGGSVSTLQDETGAINSLGDAASTTKKKMQDLIAPFDELNVLNEKTSSSNSDSGIGLADMSMDPRIEEAVKSLQVEFENVRMKANQVRDDILKFFGFEEVDGKLQFVKASFENNLINKFPQWTETIQATFDNWSGIVEGFKAVWTSVGAVVAQIAKDIKDAIINMLGGEEADSNVAQWITDLPTKLQGIADWIEDHKEGVAHFIELFFGFQAVASIIGSVINKFIEFDKTSSAVVNVLSKIKGSKLAEQFSIIGKGMKMLPTPKQGASAFKDLYDLNVLAGSNKFTALGQSIGQMGKLMGTAFSGLSGPLLIILAIVAAFAAAYATSEDFRKSANELFSSIGDILKSLWEGILKPVLDTLGPIIKDLWYNTILPILEPLMAIIADLGQLIAVVIQKIMDVVGPIIPWLTDTIVAPIKFAIQVVGAVIETVVRVIKDVIDIIKKLAVGDWKGAWQSFKQIGVDVLKGLYKVVYHIINGIWENIKRFINGIGTAVGKVKGWFTGNDSAAWTVTAKLPSPDEVFMASGGVATGPTRAVVGEGKYDEAVIPLGDSPQINEMLDKFASRVSNRPVEVKVLIGDKEWDAFTYKSAQRGANLVGATPLGSVVNV